MTSNNAEHIAELRRRIASNKGKVQRSKARINRERWRIDDAERQIRLDQYAIEEMGGKVRR